MESTRNISRNNFSYDIVIKNNKSTEFSLKLVEQIPISTHVDINVYFDENENKDYLLDEDT